VVRKALVLVVASTALLALPGVAWAHGQLRPGRAGAGVTISTVLVVPSEREGHDNARVALAVPPGFAPTACDAPVGWTCATSERGVSWNRVTGALAAEDFDLTMRVTDTPGTYLFPLSQTYDDGEERTFAGAPGSRDEAPLFTVTGDRPTAARSAGTASATAASSSAAGLAGLPAGRRLESESTDSGPVLVIGLVFVAVTALGVAVLAVRRKGGG
jgi:uncharacterized protein YcnI